MLNQFADIARERFFRANNLADTEAFVARQRLAVKAGRAHPCNARGNVEQQLPQFAAHQIGLIQRGTGNQQIRVVGTGLSQHRRFNAVAHHTAQVKTPFQLAQAPRVLVNHRNIVLLGHQAFGHALAHPTCAQNNDFHARFITLDALPCKRAAQPLPSASGASGADFSSRRN